MVLFCLLIVAVALHETMSQSKSCLLFCDTNTGSVKPKQVVTVDMRIICSHPLCWTVIHWECTLHCSVPVHPHQTL